MDSEIFPDLNHSTDTARRLIPLAGNQAAATLAALEPILLWHGGIHQDSKPASRAGGWHDDMAPRTGLDAGVSEAGADASHKTYQKLDVN